MTTIEITGQSTMREVLTAYPSAQRALFQRYHIGGCNGCGYEPDETLEQVVNSHKIRNLEEVIAHIKYADDADCRLEVTPGEVAALLGSGAAPRLIDVRTSEEWEIAHIDGSELINEELAKEMMRWPKRTAIVFYCHFGKRSLDAASYFAGHGFKNIQSMIGGIDAWSQDVDSGVPRYEVARDSTGDTTFRPLRSVVSQAKGCMK